MIKEINNNNSLIRIYIPSLPENPLRTYNTDSPRSERKLSAANSAPLRGENAPAPRRAADFTGKERQSYLKKHLWWERMKELRHDRTCQGAFEKSFLSLDALADIDPDKNALLVDRSLAPDLAVQLKLDAAYFREKLRREHIRLYWVFDAVFKGLSWRDLGIPKRTWWNRIEKIENILARDA